MGYLHIDFTARRRWNAVLYSIVLFAIFASFIMEKLLKHFKGAKDYEIDNQMGN